MRILIASSVLVYFATQVVERSRRRAHTLVHTKMRFGIFLSVICLLVLWDSATGQFPTFGRCPDYAPVADFDKERFLGMWYEQERYFTLTDLASKCTSIYYERRADNKLYANNGVVNRL